MGNDKLGYLAIYKRLGTFVAECVSDIMHQGILDLFFGVGSESKMLE